MAIVMSNAETPSEIKELFTSFLKRKKMGDQFSGKLDKQKILGYAHQYLDKANKLQSQIFDATFKRQISAMYTQAAETYLTGKERLSK